GCATASPPIRTRSRACSAWSAAGSRSASRGSSRPAHRSLDASAAPLESHHRLHDALAGLGDLALFAQPVGAVRAHLARLASDLDAHQLVDLVVAFTARRHGSI